MRTLRKPSAKRRRFVKDLTAGGYNGDCIAQTLGISKNALRRRHALDLHAGRVKLKQRKAEAGELSRAEKYAAHVILGATNSHWQTERGNLIFNGLGGDFAKSAADAYAKWLLDGGRWNCSAFTTNFSDERIAEFRALKIEAQKLLNNGGKREAPKEP